jgi:hypothetical protein
MHESHPEPRPDRSGHMKATVSGFGCWLRMAGVAVSIESKLLLYMYVDISSYGCSRATSPPGFFLAAAPVSSGAPKWEFPFWSRLQIFAAGSAGAAKSWGND